MRTELESSRRVLFLVFRRYQDADRAWHAALRETSAWFPKSSRPHRAAIGDPGSPVRRFYERRERAMLQLQAARQKLEESRRRQAERQRAEPACTLLLIAAR